MNTRPDVDVVVTAFDCTETALVETVRHVLDQSLNNLRVLAAFDGEDGRLAEALARLAGEDPRVVPVPYLSNEVGLSGMREAALKVSVAPAVMFVNVLSLLYMHACKSLLLEIEETGADFAVGQVGRCPPRRKKIRYPSARLFCDRMTIDGVERKPAFLTDGFVENKLFRRDFINEHQLAFDRALRDPDRLFAIEAYLASKRVAVVPWPVVRQTAEIAGTKTGRNGLDAFAARLAAERRAMAFLRGEGLGRLEPRLIRRFLRAELAPMLRRLPAQSGEWVTELQQITGDYLDGLPKKMVLRLPMMLRICLHLLREGQVEEIREAARLLRVSSPIPRRVTKIGDRVYWGVHDPAGDAPAELDISSLELDRRPFSRAAIRHEIESVEPGDRGVRIRVRTYDPLGVLPAKGASGAVEIRAPGGGLWRVPITLRPAGEHFWSEFTLNPGNAPRSLRGINRTTGIRLLIQKKGDSHQAPLVAPERPPVRRVVCSRRLLPDAVVTLTRMTTTNKVEITWTSRKITHASRRWKKLRTDMVGRVSNGKSRLGFYRIVMRFVPRSRKLVLFESSEGRAYTGNPRYIYEEVMRQKIRVRCVWSYSSNRSQFPPGTRVVKRGGWRFMWSLARAGYWVESHNLPYCYEKRRGTRYLQTWHGQTLKTIGLNTPGLRGDQWPERHRWQRSVDRWTTIVAPCEEYERVFRASTGFSGEVLRTGYPRNDVLVRCDEPEQLAVAKEVRAKLGALPGQRVLLYAPTFRDRTRGAGTSVRVDLDQLSARLGDDWIIALRVHPYTRYQLPPRLRGFVEDVTAYPEINDLILASDALLTDYSSVMFDYANTGKPILLFTDDYHEYVQNERGLNHHLPDIAPGPMLTETSELADALADLPATAARYAEAYERFREIWCSWEGGGAAKAVVDVFFSDLKNLKG
ncbi:CDP-glycerol glycerophosphotransferase family protein [Streptosporangium subroseum]|uniref:CDP-glycerol glycerophosphotransferase family protein n=1 Tax=Streptosporangium subroseum TaxID=106412 RepID=UPI00308B3134|nr:bifunctional glycosyltransferase family 2 protein/CDP-glycerol:glycerophosphate glycerophosphotransferase [Streptosporangium subroseum]